MSLNSFSMYRCTIIYLDILWPFALTNNAAMNNLEHTSFLKYARVSVEWFSRSEITGTKDICIFNSERRCQIAFYKDFINLHTHPKCMSVPVSPQPCQQSMLSSFWNLPNGWAKVVSPDSFNLHFSIISESGHLSIY